MSFFFLSSILNELIRMIYPRNIEKKLGFDEIRLMLKSRCLSTLGEGRVDDMHFMTDQSIIARSLEQIKEFFHILESDDDFPQEHFFDVREIVSRIRLEGTYMSEDELYSFRRSLDTICRIVNYLNRNDDDGVAPAYPALRDMAEGVVSFPHTVKRIDEILDRWGKIRDDASPELLRIRHDKKRAENSVTHILMSILHSAHSDGLVEKDANPTLRDGRLVIPVAPGLKRKIPGIVHDESASGKTVFIEPAEVVEANNRIRELESLERHEIIKVLTAFSNSIRGDVDDILHSYEFLADVDFVRAKTELKKTMSATEPHVSDTPVVDWVEAVHPILQMTLSKQGKRAVTLDVKLDSDRRILIISGPNAGGKSVCLKTIGLLQFMLQCGLSVPMRENSHVGVFKNIMIDIGDEQSIENDLSTYSSHLLSMKDMLKYSDGQTLILIDEFGTGTEPQIGGAIAEAVLKQLCIKEAYGVITTHYQNLKHFASFNKGVVNGAMLYDRQQMMPLFKLQIGQPGSSFAIDIARKIGFPEMVIKDASDIVGSDYIKSDRYLLDILRDKRYWENKRLDIHQHEKKLEDEIAKYEKDIADIESKRNEIISKAKQQAEELISESNRKIENTIKEIKERQADREATKRLRKDIDNFKDIVKSADTSKDDLITRKMEQIKRRKERKEKNKNKKDDANILHLAQKPNNDNEKSFEKGDNVKIKGYSSAGTIISIDNDKATVVFGDMKTLVPLNRLALSNNPKKDNHISTHVFNNSTREAIDDRKLKFKEDLDVRGMRGDEALNAVTYFIDDAILLSVPRVRILHGKGDGILRQLIRQYLSTVHLIKSFQDEDIRFGGAGITVVDF
jgi:DNA mismatch repair protein MutS2